MVGAMGEPDRLEGWKQVAAYLGKSERTVRRWQQEEGLPIHRHVHQQRGSVWAYPNEVDAWLNERTHRPTWDAEPGKTVTPGHLLLASLGIGLLIVAAAFVGRRTPPPPPHLETLTSLPGQALGASFSPDGSKVAFAWLSGTPDDGIYVKEIGVDRVEPLVTAGENGDLLCAPSWSPDGETLAYLRRVRSPEPTGNETWLCLRRATGGPEVQLARIAKNVTFYANNSHLSWSPDGSRLLAPMADGERRGVHWIPVAGGEPEPLTQPPDHDFAPLLSPDGRAMVYMRKTGPPHSAVETLYYQRLAGDGALQGGPRVIFERRGMTSGIGWLSAEEELVFCRSEGGVLSALGNRLYRVAVAGEPRPMALGLGHCASLAIYQPAAGGLPRLAVGSVEGSGSSIWRASLTSLDKAVPFVPSSRFDGLPSYSPDGSLTAFVSNRSGKPEVWIAARDGTSEQKLTEDGHPASTPHWHPDGSSLVFGSALPSGAHEIRTVRIADGRTTVLVKDGKRPTWANGGRDVAYWSESKLWLTGRDSLPPMALAPFRRIDASTTSGGSIFVAAKGESYTAYRVDGTSGEKEVVETGLASAYLAVTPQFIYFLRGKQPELYARPLAGGSRRLIGRLPFQLQRRHMRGFAVSPDDREVIWAVDREPTVNLMLASEVR